MNNKKYLGEGIYVDCEYCKATEEKRRILRPFLKAARKLPRYHKKCRLDGEALVLRGISYTIDKLDRLPLMNLKALILAASLMIKHLDFLAVLTH